MKVFKRILSAVLAAALCAGLTAGCAKKTRGIDLAVAVGEETPIFDPIYAQDVTSQTVLVHLYENLMRVASDGAGGEVVVNGMAKSVDIDENYDGTVTYTFRLRSAKWSDGQDVTAQDFVYAWRRLAHPASYSPYATLLSVVCGYVEARTSGDMTKLQVSAKNKSTLVVTLDGHYDWFLREVCTSPAAMPLREDVVKRLKEAGQQAAETGGTAVSWWADPTLLVTNGPYVATEYDGETALQLMAAQEYYEDGAGPDTVKFCFTASPQEAEALYDAGTVSALWPLTDQRMEALAAEEGWTPIPQLSSYTVVYNSDNRMLGDQQIRKAMALAIDRNALAAAAGVTAAAAEGLVPPGVPETAEGDFRTVGGALQDNDPANYTTRCEMARSILSEAGYNDGTELGELEYLYVAGGSNAAVAEVLCGQWMAVLGVKVIPRGVTRSQLWAALYQKEYAMAGVSLEAAGNDAECFLMDWTSDSGGNVAGYANSAYDTLMSIIAAAEDGTARMGCLHDAEELLLEDDVLTPLYTEGTDWLMSSDLYGAVRDARGWFCFRDTIRKVA